MQWKTKILNIFQLFRQVCGAEIWRTESKTAVCDRFFGVCWLEMVSNKTLWQRTEQQLAEKKLKERSCGGDDG
jgi:hypothetical protein